jgi:hypothetical protein
VATVTVDGVVFDAYRSLADTDAYLTAHVQAAAWLALSDDARGRAVVTATRQLDRLRWAGERTADDQAHAWPRTGLSDVADDETPTEVLDAESELALLLGLGQDVTAGSLAASRKKRVKAGSVEVEYDLAAQRTAARFPPVVTELVGRWLGGTSALLAGGAIATGTDGCSAFEQPIGLTRGL